jgi:sugar lactone lactonase YvrE
MRGLRPALAALALAWAGRLGAAPIINTFAGGWLMDGPALGASLAAPAALCMDNAGRLIIVDGAHGAIRRYDPGSGTVTTLAGEDSNQSFGDGGPATLANLAAPQGAWVNPSTGDIFATDTLGERIRRISAGTGLIDTVAGDGSSGFAGDGGPAAAASMQYPNGIAGDSAGNLYFADGNNYVIRKINVGTSPWTISTVAGIPGTNGFSGDGGPATSAKLNVPTAMAVDPSGQVYFVDSGNARVRRIDLAGNITTVAGTGVQGFAGDGGPALAAQLNQANGAYGLAFDAAGDLYMTDNDRVRKVSAVAGAIVPSSVINTVAGLGTNVGSGDGGPASAAGLAGPWGLAVDGAGDLYISQVVYVYDLPPASSQAGDAIRRIDAGTGLISTVAGSGYTISSGDGGPAQHSQIEEPFGEAVGPSGEIYIAERDTDRVRKVALDGTIGTVAGTGLGGFSGDGGPATAATFRWPTSVGASSAGDLYILDSANNRVRKVDSGGTITTVAGGGAGGGSYSGPATGCNLSSPEGIYVEPGLPGRLFVADYNYIRVVDLGTGAMHTFAGNGGLAAGNGGLATAAGIYTAGGGMGEDAAGNFYFTDSGMSAVRKVDGSGVITTAAGVDYSSGSAGDGGPAAAATLWAPQGLAVGPAGDLFILCHGNSTLRWVDTSGVIHPLAGLPGAYAFSGDGGPASAAAFDGPLGLALDNAGDLFVADVFNNRVREIPAVASTPLPTATMTPTFTASPTPTASPSPSATPTPSPTPLPSPCAGQFLLQWGNTGNGDGDFHAPVGVAAAPTGNIYVVDANNLRVQEFTPGGSYVTQWGGFTSPNGVAVGASGDVYVVDYNSDQVLEFGPGGAPVAQWGSAGGANGQFHGPIGLGVAPSGDVYVADTSNSRIQEFGPGGAYVGQWGINGSANGQFSYPRGVAFDASGDVYVADTGNDRVQVFSASGAYKAQWGGPGTGNGQFDGPASLAVDAGGNVYVADTNNNRVQEFAPDGTYLGQWGSVGPGSAQFAQPNGIAVDAAGSVYVTDLLSDRLQKFGCLAFSPTPTLTPTPTSTATFTATPSAGAFATPTPGPCGTIRTLAGDGVQLYGGDGSAATAAGLSLGTGSGTPGGSVAVDGSGNVYIADTIANRVRKINALSGVISTIVGTGNAVTSGDGGLASAAGVSRPVAVVADAAGDLYIGDSDARVRKVDAASGLISTVVGAGGPGYSGDGGPANAAAINEAFGLALDAAGDLYIADEFNQCVRKIDAISGIISTVAGDGAPGFSPDGAVATAGSLHYPSGVAVDASGDLYIVDSGNVKVRKVDAGTGILGTVAGKAGGALGDGGLATLAALSAPVSVVLDAAGDIYITDRFAEKVRKVAVASGIISTVAGDGFNSGGGGFAGDGGPATAAELAAPVGLALDGAGDIYIGDLDNFRVREVYVCALAAGPTPTLTASASPTPTATPTPEASAAATPTPGACGVIRTVAGDGLQAYVGDGVAATATGLSLAWGPGSPGNSVAMDGLGNLYIADALANRVRKIDAQSGLISTVAGDGSATYSGDGGPAAAAGVFRPLALALDLAGDLYIGDSNARVRRVDAASGAISTVVGGAGPGFGGDGGPASAAKINGAFGLAVDAAGDIFIADEFNQRVREISGATGLISTVAGNGTLGFAGDGGQPTAASLNYPSDVAVDAEGDLYIVDSGNARVRRVSATTGFINTVAGDGGTSLGDGGPATAAALSGPVALALDAAGDLYITDMFAERVREVSAGTGTIYTVAGDGYKPQQGGFSGDGGLATAAELSAPVGLALDSAGDLYIGDVNNFRVREVYSCGLTPSPTPTLTASPSPTPSQSPSPTPSPSPTTTPTPGPSPAVSPSPTPFAGPYGGSPYAFPQPYSSGAFHIAYPMQSSGSVEIDLFNERGDLAAVIHDHHGPGEQISPVDASQFAAGVYLYLVRLSYDNGQSQRFGPLRLVKLP